MRAQEQLLLVPASIVADIAGGGAGWGYLNMRYDLSERLCVVAGYWTRDSYGLPATGDWLNEHYCRADVIGQSGLWYRVEPELHEWHRWLSRLGEDTALELSKFQAHVLSGWTVPGRRAEWPVLTVCDGEDGPDVVAWWISAAGVRTAACVQADDRPPLSYVAEHWPVAELAETKVTVVGLGSIGSAVADALAFYGVGDLALERAPIGGWGDHPPVVVMARFSYRVRPKTNDQWRSLQHARATPSGGGGCLGSDRTAAA